MSIGNGKAPKAMVGRRRWPQPTAAPGFQPQTGGQTYGQSGALPEPKVIRALAAPHTVRHAAWAGDGRLS